MADLDKTIKAMEICNRTDGCHSKCPYYDEPKLDKPCFIKVRFDALELLKNQQPRLLTVEEVINHYSVPEEIRHDADKWVDYQSDIAPLYWEFRFYTDKYIGHWRAYNAVGNRVEKYKNDYGIIWRCWTAKPTEEQCKAVPWKDGDQ